MRDGGREAAGLALTRSPGTGTAGPPGMAQVGAGPAG